MNTVELHPAHGQPFPAIVEAPEAAGPHPAVVIVHDIYGLTDDTRRWCRRFATEGFVALAPDLYRPGGAACVTRTLLDMFRGGGEASTRIDAARAHLAGRADVRDGAIGIIGFCMGGGFALLCAADQSFAVAAPFYGVVPRQRQRLDGLCPTLAHFGAEDLVFLSHARRLQTHFKALGGPHQVVIEPGVGHSFMNDHHGRLARLGAYGPLRAAWDEDAETEAFARVLDFFSEHLPRQAAAPPDGP